MRKLLFQTLASVADGAFVVNQDQKIIFWNQAAEKALGYRACRVSDRACYEVLSGQDAQGRAICCRHCAQSAAAASGRMVPNFDMAVRSASGDPRWINVSTFAFPSSGSGAEALVVHLFRDVTQLKKTAGLLHQVLAAADRLRGEHAAHESPHAAPAETGIDLTERERQVLALLASGASTEEMARALSITTSTVRNHVRNILSKFNVHSRLEAVLHAVKRGLIALD
jgi:PAS domain S-box-containing protein